MGFESEHLRKADAPAEQQAGCANPLDWMGKNVINPVWNSLCAEPASAIVNAINLASQNVINQDILAKVELAEVGQEQPGSVGSYVQQIFGGLACALPYAKAGKLAGFATHGLGRAAKMEKWCSVGSKIAGSEKTAQILGAAVYDGLKNTHGEETHFSNAMGGAASFTAYEFLNPRLKGIAKLGVGQGKPGMIARIGAHGAVLFGIGAVGSIAHEEVSTFTRSGKFVDLHTAAENSVQGGVMNIILPTTQRALGKTIDHYNQKLGRGTPMDRARQELPEDVQKSPIAKKFIAETPLLRVQQVDGKDCWVDHDRHIVYVGKKAPASEFIHELSHLMSERDPKQKALYKSVDALDKQGKTAEADRAYVEARAFSEIRARQIGEQVARECGLPTENTASLTIEQVGAEKLPDGSTYLDHWMKERRLAQIAGRPAQASVDYSACEKDQRPAKIERNSDDLIAVLSTGDLIWTRTFTYGQDNAGKQVLRSVENCDNRTKDKETWKTDDGETWNYRRTSIAGQVLEENSIQANISVDEKGNVTVAKPSGDQRILYENGKEELYRGRFLIEKDSTGTRISDEIGSSKYRPAYMPKSFVKRDDTGAITMIADATGRKFEVTYREDGKIQGIKGTEEEFTLDPKDSSGTNYNHFVNGQKVSSVQDLKFTNAKGTRETGSEDSPDLCLEYKANNQTIRLGIDGSQKLIKHLAQDVEQTLKADAKVERSRLLSVFKNSECNWKLNKELEKGPFDFLGSESELDGLLGIYNKNWLSVDTAFPMRLIYSMRDFESRLGANNAEIGKTYHEIFEMLDKKTPFVPEHEKFALAYDILSNCANPHTIDQGPFLTCPLASLSVVMSTHHPSATARVIKEAVLNGNVIAVDGQRIDMSLVTKPGKDKSGVDLSADANAQWHRLRDVYEFDDANWGELSRRVDACRNHAGMILQLVAANAYWQRQTHFGKDLYGVGKLRYVQHHLGAEQGEAIVEMDHAGKISGVVADNMSLTLSHLNEIYEHLTGKQNEIAICNNEWATVQGIQSKQSTFKTLQEFENILRAKTSQNTPQIMPITVFAEPFYKDHLMWRYPGLFNEAGHVLCIFGIVEKDGKKYVRVDNTNGRGGQHGVTDHDGEMILLEDLYLASFPSSSTTRMNELHKAKAGAGPTQLLEIYRTEKLHQLLDKNQYESELQKLKQQLDSVEALRKKIENLEEKKESLAWLEEELMKHENLSNEKLDWVWGEVEKPLPYLEKQIKLKDDLLEFLSTYPEPETPWKKWLTELEIEECKQERNEMAEQLAKLKEVAKMTPDELTQLNDELTTLHSQFAKLPFAHCSPSEISYAQNQIAKVFEPPRKMPSSQDRLGGVKIRPADYQTK